MCYRIYWWRLVLSLYLFQHFCWYMGFCHEGAAAVESFSYWLEEQEVRGSIPRLATWISEIGYLLLQVATWMKYRLSDVNPQYNQPINFVMGLSQTSSFFLWSRISFIIVWGKFSRWEQCREKHENCTLAKIHTFTVSERCQRLLLDQLHFCNTRNIENIHTCIKTGHGM